VVVVKVSASLDSSSEDPCTLLLLVIEDPVTMATAMIVSSSPLEAVAEDGSSSSVLGACWASFVDSSLDSDAAETAALLASPCTSVLLSEDEPADSPDEASDTCSGVVEVVVVVDEIPFR
jgi:hypothetical protein